MSILTMIENAALELSLPAPSSIVSSSSADAKQLLRHAHRVGDDLISRFYWAQLEKKFTLTLVDSDSDYSLPTDFDRWTPRTFWDQSNNWQIELVNPQEWEWRQEGIIASTAHRRFIIRGSGLQRILIHPTPGTGDAGQTLSFVYQSKSWCKPTDWVTGTAFTANSYCFYNGNIYKTVSGGTTGATAPTHTSGSASDDSVTWIYQDIAYDEFLDDSDESIIDEKLIELGIQWRYLRSKGLQYEHILAEFEGLAKRQSIALRGAKALSLNKRANPIFLSQSNAPETGYGS